MFWLIVLLKKNIFFLPKHKPVVAAKCCIDEGSNMKERGGGIADESNAPGL